ncbi:type I restriction modification DNA specificity domain protein [Gardnerella vaginalis JCP8151A]|nr:type I restriction modification DNA specificity domain protein [Gardnerella vaginalis JCP8151A]
MSWKYVTLDKLGSISRGKSKHRPRNDKTLFGGKYPFIQTADVKAAGLYLTEYNETYSDKGLAQSKLWPAGTLCITIAANIADTTILGIDACFPDSVMGFIPYEDVSNVKFVKYAFDILQRDCKKISQGTAQDNLSWKKLSTIKFPAPDIETQDKIVSLLSSYDDLIENNQKQIKLLEEAAQRLYKEWFVDLHFPGYEDVEIVDGVPEGWEWAPFSDAFVYIRGRSYTSKQLVEQGGIMMVNLKNINSFGGYKRNAEKRYIGNYKDDQIVHPGDIVMGVTDMTKERRLVGHVAIIPDLGKEMTFSMDLIKLIPKLVTHSYLYSAMRFGYYSRNISQLANGVNVLHLKPDSMKNMEMLIPSTDVMNKYELVFDAYNSRIDLLEKQIEFASEARDRLLPKLMSGEIEV